MPVKISNKIVGYRVTKADENNQPAPTVESTLVKMNEYIERPEFLLGTTYKIKPPVAEHAMYITINDILLNARHRPRKPPALRSVHQLQVDGTLPVGYRPHPRHLCGIPQRRRPDLPGGRTALGIRPQRRLLQKRRRVHALTGRRNWRRD